MRSQTDSQLGMFERTVRDFAANELEEGRQENDRLGFGPLFEGVLAKANTVGFFSATMPDDLAGCDMGTTELCVLLRGLSMTDASLAGVIFTDTLAKEVVYRARGFLTLKEALGATDGAGASLFAFRSFADPAECASLAAEAAGEGAYRLSGRADYVVLGGIAGHAVLSARTGGDGYSFFVLDPGGPGVDASAPVESLGLHACPAVDLALDGAPAKLVGDEGQGAAYLQRVRGRMNAAAAAMSAGVMIGSLEEAVEYAKERRQGGREIINWSEIRRILARMAVKTKAADMALSDACRSAEENEPGWELAAQAAALFAGEASVEVTTDGIQVLGGNGYMEDYGQEKRFRDAGQVRALMGLAPIRELDLMRRVLEGEPFC